MFYLARCSLLTFLALFNLNAGSLTNDMAEESYNQLGTTYLSRGDDRVLQQINENDLVSKLYDEASNHWTTPWENVSTRFKRDVSYEKSQNSSPEPTSEASDVDYDKRNLATPKNTSPVYYEASKSGVGWWPWSSGLSPVRRSFFVPRLGKRFSGEDPPSDSDEMTPSEAQVLRDLLMDNIYYGDEGGDEETSEDSDESDDDNGMDLMEDDTKLQPRDTRAYSFVPRLGKKAYSFAPRLGKKAYSFSPRLGKKSSYTIVPSLDKKAYAFAPRLGKRKYSFAPRLGKRAYSFAPRLGKKAYSFAPRLGKKAYSFSPRLG